jgi:hypothetical protein
VETGKVACDGDAVRDVLDVTEIVDASANTRFTSSLDG